MRLVSVGRHTQHHWLNWLQGLLDVLLHPAACWRWWKMVLPWLQEWQARDWNPRYVGQWHVSHDVPYFFKKAWRRARRYPQHGVPLPILDNPIDVPCEGCGGMCCQLVDNAGFNSIHLYPWEEFVQRRPDLARPCGDRPGEYLFTFPDPQRCPLLSKDNRCTVHAYRPLACRNFVCTDGLSSHRSNQLGHEFLEKVPKVKNRLLALGYKIT